MNPSPLTCGGNTLIIPMGVQDHRRRVAWLGEHAPYDRALLTAAAERLPPAILDQIKRRGRIVLPLGPDEAQWLTVVDKGADGQTTVRKLIRVRFSRLETVV
jgi:protein-L-isoaspartate O-methyltransferase